MVVVVVVVWLVWFRLVWSVVGGVSMMAVGKGGCVMAVGEGGSVMAVGEGEWEWCSCCEFEG